MYACVLRTLVQYDTAQHAPGVASVDQEGPRVPRVRVGGPFRCCEQG
jgi:hypothetical protein